MILKTSTRFFPLKPIDEQTAFEIAPTMSDKFMHRCGITDSDIKNLVRAAADCAGTEMTDNDLSLCSLLLSSGGSYQQSLDNIVDSFRHAYGSGIR